MQLSRQINNSLVFMDTGADPLYPIEDRDGLWSQGDVQLATIPLSPCCSALVIEHHNDLYCTCCSVNLATGIQDEEIINYVTN